MWDKEAFRGRERARVKKNEKILRKTKAKARRRASEGKTAEVRNNRRCRAKRKRLGFHKISLEHPECDWHHVNKNDVVACPKYVHRAIHHICGDGKVEGVLG